MDLKEEMVFIVVDDLEEVVDVEEETVVLFVRFVTGIIMTLQFVITDTQEPCLAMVTDLHNYHLLITKPLSPIYMALAII
jgi:hypothetical protein